MVEGLGAVMAQGWLYFLGMFLVLASGFYLLSLLWGDLGSGARQVSVWGSLIVVAVAFSGVGGWMARRNPVLDGAGRAFWVVGFGLLGCAALAAGWADSWVTLFPTVALTLGVTVLTATFDEGIARYTTTGSLTLGVLLLGLSAMLAPGPGLAVVAVGGVLVAWPPARLLPYAHAGPSLRDLFFNALPGGFDEPPAPPRLSSLLVFALPLAYVACLTAAVAIVRYGAEAPRDAIAWGGAVTALFGLVVMDFDRRSRYARVWGGLGLLLTLVALLPAVLRAQSAGVITGLAIALAAARLAERIDVPRLHHLALASLYGAFFLALPDKYAWSAGHQIILMTAYVTTLAVAGLLTPRKFPNARAVLVEAALGATPLVLLLWLADPFWRETIRDFRGWRPSTLWLVAEGAVFGLGATLALGAQTRRSQWWAYLATLVAVIGGTVFVMGIPRWLGFHVTPWMPVLGVMALAFVLFELAQALRRAERLRVWPGPLRYAAYTLAGVEALLCWAHIADWARLVLALAVVAFFVSATLRRRRLGLGTTAFVMWLWALPVVGDVLDIRVEHGDAVTMGVAWLLLPTLALALVATATRHGLGDPWARCKALILPAANLLAPIVLLSAAPVGAILYGSVDTIGLDRMWLGGALYVATLYATAAIHRSPAWVHGALIAAICTACAALPELAAAPVAMIAVFGAAGTYVLPGMLPLPRQEHPPLRGLFGLWGLSNRTSAHGLWARAHGEIAIALVTVAVPVLLIGWLTEDLTPLLAGGLAAVAALVMLAQAWRTRTAVVRAFWGSSAQVVAAAAVATGLYHALPWPARGYVPFLAATTLLVAVHAALWFTRRDSREAQWSAWISLAALAVTVVPWANACAWPSGGWLTGAWGTASLISAPVVYVAAAALFARRKGPFGVLAAGMAMLVLGATASGIANLVPWISHFEAWAVVAVMLAAAAWVPGMPKRVAQAVGAGVAAYGFFATVGLFVLDPQSALFAAGVTMVARGLVAARAPTHSRWWWLLGLDTAFTIHAATVFVAGPIDAPLTPYLSVLALATAGIGAVMMQFGATTSAQESLGIEHMGPTVRHAVARAGTWLLLTALAPMTFEIVTEHLGTTLERAAFAVTLGLMTVAWVREATRQLQIWMAWIGVGAFFWLYAYLRIALDFGTAGMDPWVLLGMSFALLGVHTWLVRGPSKQAARALLGKVAQHVAMVLPAVAIGACFVADGEARTALWLTASLWYGLMGWQSRRKVWSLPAAFLANCGVVAIWLDVGVSDPMFFAVPIGLSVLGLGALFRRDLPAGVNLGIDLVGALIIYFAGMYEVVAFNGIWDVLAVAALAATGMLVGILARVRSYLYLGALFLVADVGYNLFRIGLNDRVIGMVFLFGAGVLVLGFAVLFTLKRDQLKQRYADTWANLSNWE